MRPFPNVEDGKWQVSEEWRVTEGYRSYWAVAPDDQRFLMVRDLGLRATADVILVENFLEELKDKVAR
jgi:hypothetical protein